jgi:ACS family tartrate transporter-like MFS transporter
MATSPSPVSPAAPFREERPASPERILRRIRWRLLPFLGLLYVVSYLDRVNVSFAKLTMNTAIGIDDGTYAFGAGIFFIGYFLFEVPSNLILERVGARRWIARIMLTWGLISSATAFVTGPASFVAMRFLLGLAEAGFFPGILLYLTYWFPSAERARVVGWFMVALPVSGLIGSALSGELMRVQGLGLDGWQWMLILEGLPAVVLGVACLLFLPNGPADAGWLPDEEREWLTATLASERHDVARHGYSTLRAALVLPQVWALAVAYFGIVLALYGSNFWLPTLISRHGIEVRYTGWIAALPFLCGAPFMIWWGRRSDRYQERTGHLIAVSVLGFAGFAAASAFDSLTGQIFCLCLALMGVYGSFPVFWTLPSALLTGTAAAAGLALVNSLGNLAGYVGPQVVASLTRGGSDFGRALLVLGLSMLTPAAVVLILRKSNARVPLEAGDRPSPGGAAPA